MPEATERMFPVLSGSLQFDVRKYRQGGGMIVVMCVPWAMLAPHERQAQANHDQSLNRLAERGGLGACEMLAVLEDRPWRSIPLAESHLLLWEKVMEYRACAPKTT